MPEFPPYVTRLVTELVTGVAQPSLIEEVSKVEKLGEFTQRTFGSPETAARSEITVIVQKGYGTPETATRVETQAFVQKAYGSPESPTRSESIMFSQS
jgi:hypothetical protein